MLPAQQRQKINSNNNYATFILTCSFKWNHLMVLYAYHYHPSDRDRDRRSVTLAMPRVHAPAGSLQSPLLVVVVIVMVQPAADAQWQSVNSLASLHTHPGIGKPRGVHASRWFNQIAQCEAFLSGGCLARCRREMFAATHCFNAYVSRTHTHS